MQHKNLSDIETMLHRLRAEKCALQHKMKKQEKSKRYARTRTLIQIGGLLNLTPLLSSANIELGDDLQAEHNEKAAILLGLLQAISEQLPDPISNDDLNEFKRIGKNILNKKGGYASNR